MTVASKHDLETLSQASRQIRRWIIECTSEAGSGHPTSALSAVELMVDLMFAGHFRYDINRPGFAGNDRLIFSKGHASPLLYALWTAAGAIDEQELMTYRQFGSRLEGHPTARFPWTEAATGSLGQGLSVGLGMALTARYLDKSSSRVFVLLGDSEMVEGSQWETIQLAAHYRLNNLFGIIDVNRLGQRGETLYGHDLEAYRQRIEPFGWRCIPIEDGHDHQSVLDAYESALVEEDPLGRPTMFIARTLKGRGVSFLENERGHHGKPVSEDRTGEALAEIGDVEGPLRVSIASPEPVEVTSASAAESEPMDYHLGQELATRDAYGNALQRLASKYPQLVALDGEVSNSTRSKRFAESCPSRFFEMFIGEQNMVGAATGMALRGQLPMVSTFAAFLTRAFDQIRMAPYSEANLKLIGSHAGVSIGYDGPSQMGLEDIAMVRTIQDSVVLYPSDAVSTEALVDAMAAHHGLAYLRTTRGKTPVIYRTDEKFTIGGSKVLRRKTNDRVTLIAAGITLHEALKAHDQLAEIGINARVIDLYSIKPLDHAAVRQAADDTQAIFTIEDHVPEGGLGEAVLTSLSDHSTPVICHAVRKRPISGSPADLLQSEEISAGQIVRSVRRWLEGLAEE